MIGGGNPLRLAKWCRGRTLRNLLCKPNANPPQAKVHGAHAWPLHSAPCLGPLLTSWEMQLKWQAWRNPQMPRPCSQSCISHPAATTGAAKVEFSKAGIPDEVTTKVLNQYHHYLRWDIDTKLRPALQLWVKELGSQQLSARLLKHPRLLVRTPAECSIVYLWLVSVGIDAEKIQEQMPGVMARQLAQVQSTVRAIQQGLQLTNEQLASVFKRHQVSLLCSPERVGQTLQAVADLLAVPVASEEMRQVVMVCGRSLFNVDPAVLHQRVSFFCEEFTGGQGAAKVALKQDIYRITAGVMKARAAELKKVLGWTEDELNRNVQTRPLTLMREPSTILSNVLKLQAHGFTSAQALHVVASFPGVAGYDWNSPSNVDKLQYLKLFLQLSADELASRAQILASSLQCKLGPRCEFVYRSKGIDPDVPGGLSGYLSYLQYQSDAHFAARFNHVSASPPLVYDEAFKQHWQQRWMFLRYKMGLSVADISACRPLLYTSLPNTLAPRWHFLKRLESAQADFKAADHLLAVATMSDEHFARAYNLADVGSTFDSNVMQYIPEAV
ncbi:hypothetical protein ABBQ38_008691 [Trebouxia sp. C0009 RCD-2024]